MEENETINKPTQGTYDEMTPSGERKPKVEFEMGKSVELSFTDDYTKPREYPSQDKGVYYLFECIQDGEEKVFLTAAWSLLQGLKDVEPLAGKTILVSKEMKEGKQHYSVEEVTEAEVPVEKLGESDDTDEKLSEDEENETEDSE